MEDDYFVVEKKVGFYKDQVVGAVALKSTGEVLAEYLNGKVSYSTITPKTIPGKSRYETFSLLIECIEKNIGIIK